jgi:ankyrin repeat protein
VAFPEAASSRDRTGHTPLDLALEQGDADPRIIAALGNSSANYVQLKLSSNTSSILLSCSFADSDTNPESSSAVFCVPTTHVHLDDDFDDERSTGSDTIISTLLERKHNDNRRRRRKEQQSKTRLQI